MHVDEIGICDLRHGMDPQVSCLLDSWTTLNLFKMEMH